MEEILGKHNSDESFQAYLEDWRGIMADRIEQCRAAFGMVPEIEGLILAGSNGIDAPWPLSDIDLIPIYAPENAVAAAEHVDRVRVELMAPWSTEGWRTGVDVGRLAFTTDEVATALERNEPLAVLDDERWYHSIDKGYHGRALIDENGQAQHLATWFTTWRFQPAVVERRLAHSLTQAQTNLQQGLDRLPANRILAYRHFLKAIQWCQIHLMERWGLRDNSLGRFGTRFEQAANAHGMASLVEQFAVLTNMAPAEVRERLNHAPAWVLERLDRSWKSRMSSGESFTQLQNDRDVLRVSTNYELREVTSPPYAPWLAVPSTTDLVARFDALQAIVAGLS